MALHPYQSRKLNSFDCVAAVHDGNDGEFTIQLEARYSWSMDCFSHSKSFTDFNKAVAELRKFK